MLKESKEFDQIDKLHRERTRWVTATWVFGILFALSFLGVLALGAYIVKPELAKQAKTAAESREEGESEEGEVAQAPEPQRVAGVSVDDDPAKGLADAPVTIIEFSDFLCPFCAVSAGFREDLSSQLKSRDETWEAAVPKIIDTYIKDGKVKFVFRDCPFHGEAAQKASEAAQCAQDQGKYWEMHDLLFSRQEDFPREENKITDFLPGLAQELGLNQDQFKECLTQGKYTEEVKKDLEAAKSYGVTGTPTYFVNGRKLVGAQGFESFRKVIEEELNK